MRLCGCECRSMNRLVVPLLAAVVLSGVVPAHGADGIAGMEASLQTATVLPVLLNSGAGDSKNILRLVWVEFWRDSDVLEARLRCVMLSYPQGKWRVEVAVADAGGRALQARDAVLENSGIIISIPMISEFDVRLCFDGPATRSASRFAVTVEPAPKDAPVTADIQDARAGRSAPEKGDRWIDVSVQDGQGDSVAWGMTVWKKLDGKPEPEPQMVNGGGTRYWETGGVFWQQCRSIGGSVKDEYQPTGEPYRIEGLAPGVYRLSAYTAIRPSSRDTTPVSFTDEIDLRTVDGARRVITLADGWPLTIRVMDARTGEPLANANVLLRSPNGLPAVGGDMISAVTDEEGVLRIGSLKPGDYTAEIGERNWWAELHPEAITKAAITVHPKPGNTALIRHTEPVPVRAGL